ncbi:MAG: hypothetical protein SVM80_02710 [Halobacteriota archaeon]|nr:hypothetical protein [Halobacteriota archaeon]
MKKKIEVVLVLLMLLTMPMSVSAQEYVVISAPLEILIGEELVVTGTTNLTDGTAFSINVVGQGINETKTSEVVNGTISATFETVGWTAGNYTVTAEDINRTVLTQKMVALNEETSTPTPTTTPTPTATPTVTPTSTSTTESEAKFRVGPVVRLRPVNDVITANEDGLVELFMSNPSLNDVTLHVDTYINAPSGIHVYGEGFGQAAAAGTIYGTFDVPPGTTND